MFSTGIIWSLRQHPAVLIRLNRSRAPVQGTCRQWRNKVRARGAGISTRSCGTTSRGISCLLENVLPRMIAVASRHATGSGLRFTYAGAKRRARRRREDEGSILRRPCPRGVVYGKEREDRRADACAKRASRRRPSVHVIC